METQWRRRGYGPGGDGSHDDDDCNDRGGNGHCDDIDGVSDSADDDGSGDGGDDDFGGLVFGKWW